YVLLPSSVGIQEGALNAAISNYNSLVLERQEYARTMGESNPVLQSLTKNLTDLKENIQNSLALYQNSLQIALKAAELKKSRSESRLDKVPAQELGFRNIVRQQQIVEAVYLTLLQKREEAEIRSSASGDAVKVVDYAFVSPSPVTPNPLKIFSAALALGLMIPFAYVFLKLMLNNKVRDKNDIQKMYSGAYLGEIPIMNETVLKVNDRSSGAEAFRILRSNLNFVLPKTPGSKVLYFTSTVASEGKTFSAINFAQIYGLTGKKVLLVGADIRSPKILEV